jgi:hypothetical protein
MDDCVRYVKIVPSRSCLRWLDYAACSPLHAYRPSLMAGKSPARRACCEALSLLRTAAEGRSRMHRACPRRPAEGRAQSFARPPACTINSRLRGLRTFIAIVTVMQGQSLSVAKACFSKAPSKGSLSSRSGSAVGRAERGVEPTSRITRDWYRLGHGSLRTRRTGSRSRRCRR